MTVNIANTDLTNTFDYWRSRTNEIADAMRNVVVTANGGSSAAGNAAITGKFSANSLYIADGSTPTSNITIVAPTSAQISSGDRFLNASGAWYAVPQFQSSTTLSVLAANNIDTFSQSLIVGAEYLISVKHSTGRMLTKIMLFHDGPTTTNGYISEYSSFVSNTVLGTFSATANGTNMVLTFTPSTTPLDISILRLTV